MESRTFQLLEFSRVLEALARYAASEPGRAFCLKAAPVSCADELQKETNLLRQAIAWSKESSFSMSDFPSLDGLFHFLELPRNILDLDALVALRAVFEQLLTAKEALDPFVERDWPELVDLASTCVVPGKLTAALKRCVDPDGRLKDESSPELYSVRSEIRSINQTCTRKVKSFVQSEGITPYLQEDFITISGDRYVLPLKVTFKNRFQGIIHDYSQTGETCYFEPLFLVELNNRLQQLRMEEREAEHNILVYLTGLVRHDFENVEKGYSLLVTLDRLLAKVALADALNGISLAPASDCTVSLVNARHPLLVLAGENAQPLDIAISEEQRILLVSGGNAGGKTVCLKTLGIIALMALSALPVPVDEGSVLPHWKQIFVFLGDEQSLQENVSTFTAQIRSLSRVWSQIDTETLVLLDEFGAGTDPTQGSALAQAVLETLADKGSTTVAATHFPGLKAWGMTADNVRSASVMFDPSTKKPLFKLAYDQIGASIALDVAREHGLPAEILERAERNLLLDGADTTQLIHKLNELAVSRERELQETRKELERIRSKRANLEKNFKQEKEKLLEEVKSQAQEIVKQWQQGKIERKKALKELSAMRETLAESEAKQQHPAESEPEELKVGASVLYRPWNKNGKITEKDDRKKMVKLDLGGVSLWVSTKDIGKGKKSAAKTPRTTIQQTSKSDSIQSIVLDIRGYRADEAVIELAAHIDRALLQGFSRVEVIHGRGSGVLRKQVHEFLRTFPAVTNFSLANEEEGGDGKTLVHLS